MTTDHLGTDADRGGSRITMPPGGGGRRFALVWVGQFLAVSAVTTLNFAAAYYAYDSYPQWLLGFVFALPFVPFLVSSPFAGALVDRWGARRALLVSNVVGLVLAVSTALALATGTFATWHAVVVVLAVPVLKALLLPAFEASVSFLVAKRHIGRANGTRMLVNGAGAVLGPVAAGLLLESVGIGWTGVIVAVSLCLSLLALAVVPIPRVEQPTPRTTSLWAEVVESWSYVRARHGLPALMVFFGIISFGIGFVEVLMPSVVLAFASEDALTMVLTAGAIGMALTGLLVTVWGGPYARVKGMLGWTLLFAAAIVLGSTRPDVTLLAVASFLFLGSTSVIVGNIHTLLNTKVDPGMLGRVMGWKNLVYAGLLMVGNIAAGTSSDVLQPLVGDGTVFSGALAGLVGDGPDRGFALLMMLTGTVFARCVLVASRNPQLRHLEERLPDRTPEDVALDPVRR